MFLEYQHGTWKRKAYVFLAVLFMLIESRRAFQFKDQCNSALGMGNFKIPPRSLLASREIVDWPDNNGRININNTVSGWCAGVISDKEWFQIQFDTDHYVTAVANQATLKGFVLEFTVAYSRGIGWFDYMENGTIKKFRRSNTVYSSEIVMSNLSFPVRANMIRIYPKRAVGDTCLRLELYGCQACFEPFGIEDGVIPDKAITSSSSFGPGFEPFHGRLNSVSGNGSWCALKTTDKAPYLQIDLGSRFQVSMIAIQGNPIYEFVTVLKKRVNCRYVFSPNHRFTIVCLCGHSLL
ncbi:hypothetical protein OS493_018903 [Desmophyllum pertusum]|uniref:F5/8 type C domain-containing protein n=1 Tax=Desmophyllum pertusum TaxID=174260 RepID=A0A9W9ZFB1_9CNID|nr:hypothetical protein OS493_018903 [Desmophyllum pertusum]